MQRDGGNLEVPPGGWPDREDHKKGPPGRHWGGMARLGAGVAGLRGKGGGTPRHGRGGQCLATPGPAHRPQPLALPPQEPAAAVAPAPTQAEAQVSAKPNGSGPTPSRPGCGPQTAGTGAWSGPTARGHPPAGPGPRTLSAPPVPPPPLAKQGIGRTSVTPDQGDGGGRGHAGEWRAPAAPGTRTR